MVGSALTATNCANAASQHWTLVAAGAIAEEIENTASGLCATVPSGATANGSELVPRPVLDGPRLYLALWLKARGLITTFIPNCTLVVSPLLGSRP